MITFRVDDTGLRRKVNATIRDIDNMRDSDHPLAKLDKYKKKKIADDWRKTKVTGGTVDGVRWRALRPPPDPPWGGRAKLRGKGRTLGRKRPSGRRVTPSSRLLIDTWALYNATVKTSPDIQNNTLRIGRQAQRALPYAKYQFGMRPIRWNRSDQAAYKRFGQEFLSKIARRRNAETVRSRRFA